MLFVLPFMNILWFFFSPCILEKIFIFVSQLLLYIWNLHWHSFDVCRGIWYWSKNKRTKFSAFWVVGFLSPCRKIDVYDMFYCRWHCASFSFVKCCYSVHKVRYDWIYSSLNYMCMFRRCCKPTLIREKFSPCLWEPHCRCRSVLTVRLLQHV